MTRPRKQTVDYFPHTCNHGQTMFIIEQRYGNDGYAFWFKLLELLGNSEGHFLDCNKPATWNYLAAKTLVPKEKAEEILDLLSELEAIDTELWKSKIIWSDNFLKGLAFAYRNREVAIPDKPVIHRKESGICGVTGVMNPQSKVNESKGKKTKGNNKSVIPLDFSISDEVRKWAESKGYDRLEEHLEAFKDLCAANGYQKLDWDATFKNAIRQDWGKIRTTSFGRPKEEKPTWTRELSKQPSTN